MTTAWLSERTGGEQMARSMTTNLPTTNLPTTNLPTTNLATTNLPTLRPTSRGKILGGDPAIVRILETVDRISRSSCNVLVTGETGTGKELIVAAIHDSSPRRNGPLVTINCGAIPLELVESELFGHAKGAFTGAVAVRRGHVMNAEGGTLFLDEVGELPLSVQVKLLRLLQQREYTPVGESRAIKCDVRVIAATHRDLAAEVAAGRFREDLYYRLNVIHLKLPALRDRVGDSRMLAQRFFESAVEQCGRTDLLGISENALAGIEAHAWPGNVRALENAMQRAVLLTAGPYVELEDVFGNETVAARVQMHQAPELEAKEAVVRPIFSVPTTASPEIIAPLADGPRRYSSNPMFPRCLPEKGLDLFACAEAYQNNLIAQALARTNGNKNRAAQILGVNRTTLVEMVRRRRL